VFDRDAGAQAVEQFIPVPLGGFEGWAHESVQKAFERWRTIGVAVRRRKQIQAAAVHDVRTALEDLGQHRRLLAPART